MNIRKIHGPYTRKDGRQHIVYVYEDGSKRTQSYPRYLMEQYLGRDLLEHETIDHINSDPTDNRIDNLQLLSRAENAAKDAVRKDENGNYYKASGAPLSEKEKNRKYHFGLSNHRSRGYIFTPKGKFTTVGAAAKEYGITPRSLQKRLVCTKDKWKDYYYEDTTGP